MVPSSVRLEFQVVIIRATNIIQTVFTVDGQKLTHSHSLRERYIKLGEINFVRKPLHSHLATSASCSMDYSRVSAHFSAHFNPSLPPYLPSYESFEAKSATETTSESIQLPPNFLSVSLFSRSHINIYSRLLEVKLKSQSSIFSPERLIFIRYPSQLKLSE